MCFGEWSSVSVRQKCNTDGTRECMLSTGCADTSQWRFLDCSCGEVPAISRKHWDYPSQGSSKYMTISCIHNITRECTFVSRWTFSMDAFLRMTTTSAHNGWTYIIFCGQMKHGLRVRVYVFSIHNSHRWAQDNPHGIREGSSLLQRKGLGWIHRGHCCGLCYLTGWPIKETVIFCELFYLGRMKLCP
jgi:hypothetical protein